MRFTTVLLIAFVAILIADVAIQVYGSYQYEKQLESYWSLSVKASTIEKKIENLDQFVYALEHSGLSGTHDALFLFTPDNSFDFNLTAIKSLQLRLHEIKGMDISSFQYQTALAQITQHEQNEAGEMLSVFRGCWWLNNHFFFWDWVGLLNVVFSLLGALGICIYKIDEY